MKRRPPRSTRTDTLVPYTTLFRSPRFARTAVDRHRHIDPHRSEVRIIAAAYPDSEADVGKLRIAASIHLSGVDERHDAEVAERSEERRVEKECVSQCRSRRSQYTTKNNNNE